MLVIIGSIILVSLAISIYVQIPNETPEIIAARKFYGKSE